MRQQRLQRFNHRLAIALSILLHSLLLGLGYYFTMHRPISLNASYSVAFTTTPQKQSQKTASDKPATQPTQRAQAEKKTPTLPKKASTQVAPKPTPKKKTDTDLQHTDDPAPTPQAQHVDERGLYQAASEAATGVKLDLAGWIWDVAPQPNDDTDESGKISFEIQIDEMGEVVAIKTIEKTVSPLVEAIYKNALTELTFSRTNDNVAYAATYTGKVTFILQAR